MAFIDIQGCDWSQIEIALPDLNYSLKGVTGIDFGETIDRTKAYGAGREAYDYSPGTINAEDVKVTVSIVEWNNFVDAAGGMDVLKDSENGRLNMSVQYRLKQNNPVSVRLEGLCYQAQSRSHSQGTDQLSIDVTFTCLKVVQ